MKKLLPFAASVLILWAPLRASSSYVANFNSMSTGSIAGQQGWNSSINAGFDQAVAATGGGNSFRVSNATDDGAFADNPYGPLITPAGDPSTGAPNNFFQMSFDFSSVTGSHQPGLLVGVAPYGGPSSSARQGSIFLDDDKNAGLVVIWNDYFNGGFRNTTIAAGLSYTTTHTVSVSILFIPGLNNDVASISVDGGTPVLLTDYEGFYPANDPSEATIPMNTVAFRSHPDATTWGGSNDKVGSGTNDAAVNGNGFYFDALSYSTSDVPEPATLGLAGLALCAITLRLRRRAS